MPAEQGKTSRPGKPDAEAAPGWEARKEWAVAQGRIATPEGGASPLSGDEEALWRDLIRIVVTLPRALDDDLARMAGISLSEYAVLMNLSEAEGQGLRLSALAAAVALSLSRVSRLVDELQAQGLVTKARDAVDTRGSIATLTPAGLDRLRRAYPAHLLSARQRVMDHVPAELVLPTTRALAAVAATMR